ncbi:MAG TPA: hypothetical protein PLJ47_10600 [Candidatus Hydrogenedentes bacterium]|nr:hypothetical protein [Candidatus Hydrogenedentota bacterium]
MKRRRRAAYAVVVTGLATILSVLVMHFVSGKALPPHAGENPEGFRSAMIWLELVSSREEVFAVLGPYGSPEGTALRNQLDTANFYDFAFMTCYSLYNACLIYFVMHLQLYRLQSILKLRTFLGLGLILSAAMFIGDIVETTQLLTITKAHGPNAMLSSVVSTLQYWTRVKWAAIFIVCLMLCAGYASYFRRIPSLLLPAIYAVAGVAGLVSISLPNARPLLETIASPAIALGWVLSLFHAGVVAVRGPAGFALPEHLHARRRVAAAQQDA